MPMRRYEIRNEYGLGDAELHKAADKDDPEALLEAVAMSGLVGVLRQLGDLAEFAAGIFHDLHEEVMATAARGHGLMARVQQLEAEFPLIEKAFLSQTNHSPFFTNSGVDWHTNLRMEQNLITRGDLPRFVMDSCEQCRGPPLLCHLDKFDVAGVGACLKRYTDPSFFKVEAASSEIPTVEVQREKKVRKAKKKASRWRNGETPEVVPASHAKLHQLFLEEHIENGHSDPARLVKLKRRNLNGSPFDQKSGKSYMEKFLETSLENKMVCADSVTSPLRLTLDNSGESGFDIHEISVVSPVKKSSQGKETTFSLGDEEQVLLENYVNEAIEENFDKAIVAVPDPIGKGETHESSSTVHEIQIEEDLSVDADDKTEGSLDEVHSDDMNSEVENYMDALTTMESELETDNESKPKNGKALMSAVKHWTNSDANQERMDVQGNFSDSQSIGNSSLSYDSSVRKGQSSFSYSDSLSNLAENTPSDGEGAAESLPFIENCVAEVVDLPSNHPSLLVETVGTESHDLMAFDDTCLKDEKTPDPGEASCVSCPTDSKAEALPSGSVRSLPDSDIALGSKLPITDRSETHLTDSFVCTSNVQDFLFVVSSERHLVHELDQEEDPNMFSDSLMHTSPLEELDLENKCISDSVKGVDKVYADNLTQGSICTPQSIIASVGEQLTCSASPDAEADLGVTSLPGILDALRSKDLDFETRVDISEADAIEECDWMDETVCVSQVELNYIEENKVPHSEEKIIPDGTSGSLDTQEMGGLTSKVDEVIRDVAPLKEMGVSMVLSDTEDGEEIGSRFTSKVDGLIGDNALLECPCNSLSELGSEVHEHSDNEVTKLQEKDAAPSVAAVASPADASDGSARNVISSSSDLLDVQLSLSGSRGILNEEFSSEAISPERLAEALYEVKPEATIADLDSSSYKSVSGDDYSRLNVYQFAPKSSRIEQTQGTVHDGEETGASSTEPGNWDSVLEKTSEIKSVETRNDVVGLPTSHLPQAESSAEFSIQAEQITTNNFHAIMGGANSESLNVVESVSSAEQSFELQSNELVGQSSVENGQSTKLLDLQPEQSRVPNHIDEASCRDDPIRSFKSDSENLPRQDLLLESGGNKLASVPFSSVFPSPGLQHEPIPVNLDKMPPLPPLPPMQWRMGKVQPAPLSSQREWVDQNQGTFPPMQPRKAPMGLPSSGNVIVQSSVPSLYHMVEDSQRPQHIFTVSGENSWSSNSPYLEVQTINDTANSQETRHPLEEAQSSSPYVTLTEAPNERLEPSFHEFYEEEKQCTSDPLSTVLQLPAVKPTSSGHDPVPSNDLPSTPKAGLEMPEQNPQTLVGKEVNVCDNSVEPLIQVERQPQDDLTMQAETTWSPSTLALPPTYGLGKLNGSKFHLPRNPLIDAVAAHGKSKLRKVAERVRPQIIPKLEERDSLLEQIRTKSFNLKPASTARPSIQGMQGPKTNLKVAAILEKANAIRQALAGSDEGDDSDSWSDT